MRPLSLSALQQFLQSRVSLTLHAWLFIPMIVSFDSDTEEKAARKEGLKIFHQASRTKFPDL